MLNKKAKILLEMLLSGEYQTAKYLSSRLNVSEKTVRSRIYELADELKEYGAEIISKPRFGYQLKVGDSGQYAELEKLLSSGQMDCGPKQTQVPQTNEERVHYILAYLINRRNYVKSDELARFLFISKSTLSVCMKSVNSILGQYELELERRPGYGLKIRGKEFNIRRFLCDYYIKNDYLEEPGVCHHQHMVQIISQTVWKLLEKYQIHMPEIEFEVFASYIYTACKRVKYGFSLLKEHENICVSCENEDRFITEMAGFLEEKWQIVFSEPEKQVFLLYLKGRQYFPDDFNFTIHEVLDRLAVSLIAAIKKEYMLDFSSNLDFRMALNQHLVPFDIRMRYGISINNPILDEIKKTYSLAYEMVGRTFYVIHAHYKKEVSENERGFFALIYALALEKDSFKRENNVLIVCSSGKGTSQMLKYRFKEKFSDYINHIYVSDLIGLESFDFSGIDYIFTTVPIRRNVPVPILEISMFMGDEDVKVISKVLKYGHVDILRSYYIREHFYSCFQGDSKEEVLRSLCRIVIQKEQVDEDFEKLVFEREELAQMNFGTAVAMPHPSRQASDETFVYVAVLEKPVRWNSSFVQVVILVSIGRNNDKNRKFFYEVTSKFVLSDGAVNALISHPVYEELLRLLSQVWEE